MSEQSALPLDGIEVPPAPPRVVRPSAPAGFRRMPPFGRRARFVDGRILPPDAWPSVFGQSSQDPDHQHVWQEVIGARHHRWVCTATLPPAKPGEDPRPCPAITEWEVVHMDPDNPDWNPGTGARSLMPDEVSWQIGVRTWLSQLGVTLRRGLAWWQSQRIPRVD